MWCICLCCKSCALPTLERMTVSVPRGDWMQPPLKRNSCRTWASGCWAVAALTWWSRLSTCWALMASTAWVSRLDTPSTPAHWDLCSLLNPKSSLFAENSPFHHQTQCRPVSQEAIVKAKTEPDSYYARSFPVKVLCSVLRLPTVNLQGNSARVAHFFFKRESTCLFWVWHCAVPSVTLRHGIPMALPREQVTSHRSLGLLQDDQ